MLLFKEKFYFIFFFMEHEGNNFHITYLSLSLYSPTHPSMCMHVCKYAGALVCT